MKHITPNRVHSVDILRGLAIFFMIFVHYGQSWMSNNSLAAFYSFFFIPSFIGGPIFMIVAGISFSLSAEKRKFRENFRAHVYKRAALLILMQFFLNLAIFNINQAWTYEVLILVGVAQLVCYYLLKKSNLIKILVVFLLIVVVPFLRNIFGYQIEKYSFTLFEPIWNFQKFFSSMIVNYPFALFPYLSYIIFGMIIGDAMVQTRYEEGKEKKFCKNLIIYGGILILLGIGFRLFNSPLIDSYEEGLHVFLTTGLVMFLLSGLYWLDDVKKISLFRSFSLYGQISLTFLIGHHFINKYLLFYTFKIWKNLSIYSYLILVTFLCLIFLISSKFWSILNYKFSLDWLIRKMS